jgi:hypothetical protein
MKEEAGSNRIPVRHALHRFTRSSFSPLSFLAIECTIVCVAEFTVEETPASFDGSESRLGRDHESRSGTIVNRDGRRSADVVTTFANDQ